MKLNYIEFGIENKNKQSLVVLHGLFGSSRNWQSISKQLARSHHVITVDLRNHGKSFHSETMDYFNMAEDISNLIKELKLENPILVGHSMGGKVVMTIALKKLVEIKKLIVLDIAPFNYTHNFDVVMQAMTSLDISTLETRSEADTHMQQYINNPDLRLFLLHNLRAVEGQYRWQINLESLGNNMENILGFPFELEGMNSALNSLFLAGSDSNYVEEQHHAYIYEYFPNAKIEYIDDASHWLHAEQPHKVIASIENFIENS